MIRVRTLRTAEAPAELLAAIRAVLDDAFAGGFTEDDWDHSLGGWHIVVTDDDDVAAHAALVARPLEVDGRAVHTGYVEAVAVAPTRQRGGLGSLAMAELDRILQRNFAMGALSTGSPAFYERLGWERWQGPTFVRRADGLERTAEEDDGIMVRRFGPSAGVDLTAAVSCDDRAGDVW